MLLEIVWSYRKPDDVNTDNLTDFTGDKFQALTECRTVEL